MKKITKVLPVVMVICLMFAMFTMVFADNITVPNNSDITDGGSGTVTTAAKGIWSTVVTIVQILAVAAVVFAGLRYMFASADEKADIKKSMGILAIGAVLVFGATLVLQLIQTATTEIIQTQTQDNE